MLVWLHWEISSYVFLIVLTIYVCILGDVTSLVLVMYVFSVVLELAHVNVHHVYNTLTAMLYGTLWEYRSP